MMKKRKGAVTLRMHLHKQISTVATLILITSFCWCTQVMSAEVTLFSAKYHGKHSGFSITAERELKRKEDGSFVFVSEVNNTLGHIKEISRFNLISQGTFKTREYQYKRKIMGFGREESIAFDWGSMQANYERKGKSEKNKTHTLTALETLDPALYQLKMQQDLYRGKKKLNYTFVKERKIKNLEFEVVGMEDITLNDKEYSSVKIQRINVEDDKRTFVWFIPSLHYQIAKIWHQEDDGETFEILLRSFKLEPELKTLFYENPVIDAAK